MAIYSFLMRQTTKLAHQEHAPQEAWYDVLLTGTFYSDNWIIPHLCPLASSKYCKRVRMVASDIVPAIEKVEAVYAPKWLTRIMGKIPARLMVFVWIAIRERPHVLGGFHLLPNGLVAALVARFISAKALYICGGGPRELIGGGYLSGNRVFGKMKTPDPVIERHLLDSLPFFDLIITMGSNAIRFFKQYADTEYHVISGGFDESRFYPAQKQPVNDLILIGRLSYIKRVDVFLQSVRLTCQTLPNLSAVVVGDGPDRPSLEQMAEELEISRNVKFVGHQDNVEEWLRSSRIFVLTSDSEGLAQAMIQAMLCGLPAVVSDVGDLGDLVKTGVNGYLVHDRKPATFAECFISLLRNSEQLAQFGKVACQTAKKYEMRNVINTWDEIFRSFNDRIITKSHSLKHL